MKDKREQVELFYEAPDGRMLPHGWRPETMDRCRETFLDSLSHLAVGPVHPDMKEIQRTLTQYNRIQASVDRYEWERKSKAA